MTVNALRQYRCEGVPQTRNVPVEYTPQLAIDMREAYLAALEGVGCHLCPAFHGPEAEGEADVTCEPQVLLGTDATERIILTLTVNPILV